MTSYLDPKALVEARRKAGLTQEALAKKVNRTTRSIVWYEAGSRCPSSETLQALAKTLGVHPVSLTTLKDPTDAPNP
jgi:ribosome-binding protein aMBF1 (putative translation factor)